MRPVHRILAAGALALVAAISLASPASPASTATKPTLFLKIDGIPGESTVDGHVNEIELLSFSFGATNSARPDPGSGGGAGKVTFQDLHISKQADVASARLLDTVARGTHIPTATLTVEQSRPGSPAFYVVVMHDVLIRSFQTGAGNGLSPVEEVALAFGSIEFTQG